jgi:septal ring factor EnvC (AmiA/AmiB activator)
MRGRLRLPVEGRIISSYGKVRHPKFQTVTFNNGIVIEARQGSVVKSVYDGKVAYTGWLKGYGQIVILDNGDGFYTLFAHLQKALKERGQEVKKGEDVGLAGDTGADGVAGLYFEIREKGIPRDPVPWFASVK